MQSRNQREGQYAGKYKGMHFRTRETYLVLRNFKKKKYNQAMRHESE